MSEEKKSAYKGNTPARREAVRKYLGKMAEIKIRLLPELKDQILEYTKSKNESMNHFIIRAVEAAMQNDL